MLLLYIQQQQQNVACLSAVCLDHVLREEPGHCIAKLVFLVNAQVHLRSLHLLRHLGITHILNATEDLLLPEPEASFQCAPAPLHMGYPQVNASTTTFCHK